VATTLTKSIVVSLNIAQVRQHGWARCIVGGGSMYLSIPSFLLLNLTLVMALFSWVLTPLFGLPRVRWADHVLLARGRVAELFWLDRLNCQFCAYANGLCTMLNTQLDHLASASPSRGAWRWSLAALAALASAPSWLLFDIFTIRVLYDLIISRCLRMHRSSRAEIHASIVARQYASQHNVAARAVIRAWKGSALALASLLEQIESAWCPLRHIESHPGVVVPAHHANFLPGSTPEELRLARRELHAREGTLSPRGLARPER